ncbi:MAG TPA: hypothetical protein VFA17_02355 [Thermoplasmata archaeon]|jgi:hypothetical protein|nr:hypothetical protein [Thermoplasmata archaeon]
MGRGFHISTELAFLLSGVFIMLVAWALNFLGTLSSDPSSGHGVSDEYLWLFMMFQGLGFSAIGVAGANYREFVANPRLGKRYLVGFLLIADGGLHLLALNQHLAAPGQAAFFAIVSPIQIVGGVAFFDLPRRLDPVWLLFTGFLIAAFVLTRTVPVWPVGVVEEVDALGLLSKAVEVATIAGLLSMLRHKDRETSDPRPASSANGP